MVMIKSSRIHRRTWVQREISPGQHLEVTRHSYTAILLETRGIDLHWPSPAPAGNQLFCPARTSSGAWPPEVLAPECRIFNTAPAYVSLSCLVSVLLPYS